MAALCLVGIALRLLVVPMRLVMVFHAYRLAQEAALFLSVPKYGPATFVLYRAAFAVFGPDHATMVATNTVLGCLSVVLLPALLARFFPPRGSTAAAAALVALVPVFLKDHRSESILVAGAFFLWCALVLWDAWLSAASRRADLVGAVAFAALAANSRPEMLAVAPLALAAMGFARGKRPEMRPLGLAALAFAALCAPRVWHLWGVTAEHLANDNLPALDALAPLRALYGLWLTNLVFRPGLFPCAIPVLAALALPLAPRLWRLWAALSALGMVWITSYVVDLPETSIPRLHVPGATLVALAAALGVGALWERSRMAAALALAAVAATAVPSARALWRPTNEDEEEKLIRGALARLPPEPVCLVRIDHPDEPPGGRTHRDFPDYLLRPPHRPLGRLVGIRGWESMDDRDCPGGTFFFLGYRCYALYSADRPRRDHPPLVASCARMLEKAVLEPVFEREIENHGDNEFRYWPQVEKFRVGLYRVRGAK